jgi:CheY-like chemotaxis protein
MITNTTMTGQMLAILTVDDEKIILDSVRAQLERNFHQKYLLEFAQSAEEAMEITSELVSAGVTILLIISDYQMDGMKGDEFARWVRNNYPQIKVVMLTGHMGQDLSKTLLDADVVEKIIQKPWKESELVALVESLGSEGNA